MHHFVRWTTRLLGLAVARSEDPALRESFVDHLRGEVNHERILERDLQHLGEDLPFVLERSAADVGTRVFMAVQESLVGFHGDPLRFLASPLAAEGLASHLDADFLEALEAKLARWGVPEPRRAMTFFSSHVSTDGGDDGHWKRTLATALAHVRSEDELQAFLGHARASMHGLGLLYESALDDLAVFAPPP
jgi:hypothetical protein